MSRLDDIIRRNQPNGRPRERVVVSMVFGAIILLVIGLMVFTNLGAPPVPEPSAAEPVAHPHHADGVFLGRPRPRPAPAAPAK
ncbi:MAG TPA: hypothetical protein VGC42_18030 [Kofleriaceae bacterium]